MSASLSRASVVASLGLLLAACATGRSAAPTGAETFARHCAACHGTGGAGDGPVAGELNLTVPDLRILARRNGGVFPADAVASYIDGREPPPAHGNRQMPVWGTVFDATARLVEGAEPAAARIDEIVAYLRGLQRP